MIADDDMSDFSCGYQMGYQTAHERNVIINTSLGMMLVMVGFVIGLAF